MAVVFGCPHVSSKVERAVRKLKKIHREHVIRICTAKGIAIDDRDTDEIEFDDEYEEPIPQDALIQQEEDREATSIYASSPYYICLHAVIEEAIADARSGVQLGSEQQNEYFIEGFLHYLEVQHLAYAPLMNRTFVRKEVNEHSRLLTNNPVEKWFDTVKNKIFNRAINNRRAKVLSVLKMHSAAQVLRLDYKPARAPRPGRRNPTAREIINWRQGRGSTRGGRGGRAAGASTSRAGASTSRAAGASTSRAGASTSRAAGASTSRTGASTSRAAGASTSRAGASTSRGRGRKRNHDGTLSQCLPPVFDPSTTSDNWGGYLEETPFEADLCDSRASTSDLLESPNADDLINGAGDESDEAARARIVRELNMISADNLVTREEHIKLQEQAERLLEIMKKEDFQTFLHLLMKGEIRSWRHDHYLKNPQIPPDIGMGPFSTLPHLLDQVLSIIDINKDEDLDNDDSDDNLDPIVATLGSSVNYKTGVLLPEAIIFAIGQSENKDYESAEQEFERTSRCLGVEGVENWC
ncbi:uncharacterized protein LOC113218299 [Frankliniella occidentalis]|uniref:Uncharacterized protein LOC113218299 n=1 Tax=Frankliniella occidentalis TaxID=133901 RepID=A0A9C6XSM0_FRAOC|nr:uncharacterized protein LOC113218299 [Frankliniella occidentalis]